MYGYVQSVGKWNDLGDGYHKLNQNGTFCFKASKVGGS